MIEYTIEITYKKVKNINLRVRDNKVLVSAPFYASKSTINSFIKRCEPYILKQLNKQKSIKEDKVINLNDEIIIFDNAYTILETTLKPKITQHYIFVKNTDIRKQIKLLFKEQLYKIMYELTLNYFNQMDLNCKFPTITLKDVKSRWGCYNRKKHEISYALELIFKDKKCYDYLVVHELSHILEFNHSKKFYDVVSKYCPNYKLARKQLKEK